MKNLPKLSFKKRPKNTGLHAIGNPHSNIEIKSDKKWCGTIDAPNWQSKDNKWIVRFTVTKSDIMEDKNPNCPWKWITLAVKFENESDAKEFIKRNWEEINQKFNIRKSEE